jgi:hypothetical protein
MNFHAISVSIVTGFGLNDRPSILAEATVICRAVSIFIISSSSISPTSSLLAERTKVCPHLHLPFTFLTAHFLSHLAHLLALPWTASVSLALLPISTFIRYFRFLSLTVPPTVYRGRILLSLLLGNERLIWCVAHVNASCNMSKRAWIHAVCCLNTPATRCCHSGY